MIDLKTNTYQPSAIPPGETLLELLEVFNMSQRELAERMGRPLKLVNEIIKGKATITPETAIQLERVLGKEASFWTRLEAGYQSALARIEAENELAEEKVASKKYPYREMVKNGWLPEVSDMNSVPRNLLGYFGVNSLKNILETKMLEPILFRISTKRKIDPFATAAWLRKGVVDAQELDTQAFNAEILENRLGILRKFTTECPEDFLEKIQNHLAEAGVAFVVTKNLPNVPVKGASRWLSPDRALIQLSIYGRFADMFWFSLFHEIGHILKHGKRTFNIDIAQNDHDEVREAEANEFAKDILIPRDEYLKFLAKKDFTASSISLFAKNIGVHTGIIVGRLQHDEHLNFNQLNELRIRFKWRE